MRPLTNPHTSCMYYLAYNSTPTLSKAHSFTIGKNVCDGFDQFLNSNHKFGATKKSPLCLLHALDCLNALIIF